MTFLNITLLGGAGMIALPIVLHLIMRRKPKRLVFPALRFVRKRHETNQRRLRLRHLLLLLLRAAAIALLAFALARPSVTLSGVLAGREEPVAAALVFDASPRMQYRQQNRTRLEVAQETGQWLLAQLPRESDIAVLDTRLGPAAFEVDRASARNRVERMEAVSNSQPVTEAIDKALELLRTSDRKRREVYVFTDLGRTSWPRDAATRLQEQISRVPGVGIYVIDVGIEEPADFALGELRLPHQVVSSRGSLVVETEFSAVWTEGQRTIELALLTADPATGRRSEQNRGEQIGKAAPGQSQQIVFRVGGLATGTHQGRVRIVGEDALPANDVRYFTFEVRPAWRVLVVAPKTPHVYPPFLTEALAPTEYRLSGQARYDCRVIAQDELAAQNVEDYSAVCLLDPKPMDDAAWQKLVNYTADGHGLAVFLGRNAEPVESFNGPVAQQLLPGPLKMQVPRPDFDTYLAPTGRQHPVLAELNRLSGSVPWDAYAVASYWQLGPLAKGVDVIVPYHDPNSDGQPALLERAVGKGRVLTMTTPVSDDTNREPWNYLPAGDPWPYLILVNEAMAYLVGAGNEQLNYYSGQTVVLQLDPQNTRRSFVVTAPGEVSFPVAADPQENQLVVSEPERPGNYRVQSGGGAAGVDRGFSVNLRPEQTRLDRVTSDDLDELLGRKQFRLARNRDEIDRDVSLGRVGQELFPYLMVLVGLILGVEHVVANRFYRD